MNLNSIDQVDAIFSEWDKPDSPGCALAVIKDGEIIYKRGYGMANLEFDIPITPSTVFDIGSTSKQFTALCIALLARQGKLSLHDDVKKFIPELTQYDKTISIRHLVHHISGIRD
jgi:CubicO group peptidase (beta-lactamase class C family)